MRLLYLITMMCLLETNLFTCRVFQTELKAFVGLWLPVFICVEVTALSKNSVLPLLSLCFQNNSI